MLSQQQYSNVLLTAQRANAVLAQTLRAKEALGKDVDWNLAACQGLKIKSGQFSLKIADYNSEAAVDIYNQLVDIGSTWMGGIAIDPNSQLPGITVDVNYNQTFNSNIIPFTNQTTVSLTGYQTNYKPVYGSIPIIEIFVNNGDGTYAQDEQTAPIYTYVVPGVPTSGIDSITWGYPLATSGYIQISGSILQQS